MERRSELFPVWFLKCACWVRLYLFWIDFVVSLHSAVLRYYSAYGNQFLWKLTLTYANFPDELSVTPILFWLSTKINKTSIFNFHSPDKLFYNSKRLCKSRTCSHLTFITHTFCQLKCLSSSHAYVFIFFNGLANISLNNLSSEGECYSILFLT